ncbi:glycosyltransferase family 61 protein [Pseudomonas monteilii]
MMKINQNSKFDFVYSLAALYSSQTDSIFEAKEADHNYVLKNSKAVFTEQARASSVTESRQTGCSFLNEKLTIPSLALYKIHNPIIFPGKIRSRHGKWHANGQLLVTAQDGLFPESYGVMDGGRTLPSDILSLDASEDYSLHQPKPTKLLKGRYLFLGSMHDHFGHFLVEGLSRLWILQYLSESDISSLKIIIYEPGIIPPATKILEYLGIKKSQIYFLNEPCIVEELIAPSIAYRTHFWARSEMNAVYEKVASAALQERPSDFPKKVFLSRNKVAARKLTNEVELESLYKEAGYWIIRPEDLPIGDQIRIAAGAECIAGCTGSNMYLALFQKKGGINHIYAPYDFTLKDDAMISNIRESKLTYVIGSQLSDGRWTIDMNVASQLLKNEIQHG